MGQQANTISKFEAGIADQTHHIQSLEQEIEMLEKQLDIQVSQNTALQTSLQNLEESSHTKTTDLARNQENSLTQVGMC